MQNYQVELLRGMLEIYSPSGSEQQLAAFLEEQMRARGFKVRTDDVGNVIGELGADGPRILLCGHMDTVPGEIPVRLEGDFLYGRGSVDAKSSLAAMIAGASTAATSSPAPFRVTVAGVVEEERSSEGARALIASGNSYDLAVFGEPSGASNIIIGYKGSLQLHVTTKVVTTKPITLESGVVTTSVVITQLNEFRKRLKSSLQSPPSSETTKVVTTWHATPGND